VFEKQNLTELRGVAVEAERQALEASPEAGTIHPPSVDDQPRSLLGQEPGRKRPECVEVRAPEQALRTTSA
jgi:hypothetical protein